MALTGKLHLKEYRSANTSKHIQVSLINPQCQDKVDIDPQVNIKEMCGVKS